MKKKFRTVYQFRIALRGIEPLIWRRIQVPGTYTFWDLHVAVQDVMGWTDTHLHEFRMPNPLAGGEVRIGIPHEDFEEHDDVVAGWKQRISRFFSPENREAEYIYDFGDNWIHAVTFEEIVEREENVDYPLCIGGQRSCPPEDCGGQWGYEEFLEIIMDPRHERYGEMLAWVGGEFEPERFDLSDVIFDDPVQRLRSLRDD